jgi:hypothetical protein
MVPTAWKTLTVSEVTAVSATPVNIQVGFMTAISAPLFLDVFVFIAYITWGPVTTGAWRHITRQYLSFSWQYPVACGNV